MADLDLFEEKEVSWNIRKGHRHLLDGLGKGRSSYSQSVNSKWIKRHGARVDQPGQVEPKGKTLRSTRRCEQESHISLVKSGLEALEWQSQESTELWWWHYGADSETEDDFDEISWTRQSTGGSSASTACSAVVSAKRWNEAEKLAEGIAKKFQMTKPRMSRPAKKEEPSEPVQETDESDVLISNAARFDLRPLGAGAPPESLLHLHDEVLKMVGPTSRAKTHRSLRCKVNAPNLYACEEVVRPESEEYQTVTRYFEGTLGQRCTVQSLTRLDVPKFAERFRTDGDHTIMFHGCRSESNERSIVADGFRVSSCSSGGRNFGTWFAYKADYSNVGYAFDDKKGWRHLFICVVSYYHTVLDNGTMRVVGQGCAYPQWLLRYKVHPPPRPAGPLPPPAPIPAKVTAGRDRTWYVVRNGKWELEKT